MGTILLIGTLDSKGDEYAYARDLIKERGHTPLLLHAGTFEPAIEADISADEVAAAAGADIKQLRDKNDRGEAVEAMTQGVATLVPQMYSEGRFDGVLALGGSGGTALATAAMRELPVGVPKVMVSTVASGDVAPYVDVKDITMMYSVVDISGINQLSRRIIGNAAGAVCGMVEQTIPAGEDKPLITATMFGVTTPCVTQAREKLEEAGYEVLVFHATGSGGRAMEALIADGFIEGVADITTTEWGDELIGGVLAAGPNRLDAAAKTGLPQVVAPGALDMVNFWAIDTVPSQFKERNLYKHNANITLMRTTPEENAELGRIIAEKLNQATGPTAMFIPLKGVSMLDVDGSAFWSPEADEALFNAIRETLDQDKVELIELDMHINDPEFSAAMADKLMTFLKKETAN